MGKTSKRIANFPRLPKLQFYADHYFRRLSGTQVLNLILMQQNISDNEKYNERNVSVHGIFICTKNIRLLILT